METEAKKKGLLATIWESMTKTGGCCGPGESCCSPSNEDNKKSNGKKKLERRARLCCLKDHFKKLSLINLIILILPSFFLAIILQLNERDSFKIIIKI